MGQDKALLSVLGKPLMSRVLAQLDSDAFGPVSWVRSESPDSHFSRCAQALGTRVLPDLYPGEGPLGALLSVCADLQDSWFLLGACDTLNIQSAELRQLYLSAQQLDQTQTECDAVAYASGQHWESLWALYHTRIQVRALELYQRGERSLQRLLNSARSFKLEASGRDWWQINRPVDLKRAEALLKGQAF